MNGGITMKTKAKQFAIRAHEGQTRKSSGVPYITHPIRVAESLEQAGFSDELVSAGYLHDVVEDTPYGLEEIKDIFGGRVAHLVAANTEDKSKTWQERKRHTIDGIKHAGKEVKYLIVADKLDNLLDLEEELRKKGDAVWENFTVGFEQQGWYNKSIAENMDVGLDEKDIPDYFREYEEAVKRVFSQA
jgi:(p)ppGpp synthase/HD superfamily hydrolase